MKNVSDLLKRLEAQSEEELALFEAQTRSELTSWHKCLLRSLRQSLATIESDMGRWVVAVRDSQHRQYRHFRQNWTLMTTALAIGLFLGGLLGMTEIARALAPPVPITTINGRLHVLIDRTQPTYQARDPKSLWAAVAR